MNPRLKTHTQSSADFSTSGTLGKALGGASGGFTAARREVVELLRQAVNRLEGKAKLSQNRELEDRKRVIAKLEASDGQGLTATFPAAGPDARALGASPASGGPVGRPEADTTGRTIGVPTTSACARR